MAQVPKDSTHIKSFIVTTDAHQMSTLFVLLSKKFKVCFDDLANKVTPYYYRLTPCDRDWQPSQVMPQFFFEGTSEAEITDMQPSFGTLTSYTHYQFQIPNDFTKIISSGNYLLQIIDEQEHCYVTRRIVVYENRARVTGRVVRMQKVADIFRKQVLRYRVHYPDDLVNPIQNSQLVALQNGDWHFKKVPPNPTFVHGEEAVYHNDSQSGFWGNNEFYFFDTKSFNTGGYAVYQTQLMGGQYHTFLYPTPFRSSRFYGNNPDVNGAFIIRSIDVDSADLAGEYSYVHFSFENNKGFPAQTPLYLYGAFNNYQCDENTRLKYDATKNTWEAILLLKQGFYNYTVAMKTAKGIDLHLTNGTFFQTENQYQVLVYYKNYDTMIDQIIGLGTIDSIK